MARELLVAPLVVAALLAIPPVAPQVTEGAVLNVVEAIDLGCSGDVLSRADMRITVYIDGVMALRTQKGQDVERPLYAAFAGGIAVGDGVLVRIMAEEAEPGGLFGLGTDWVGCDVDPGPSKEHSFAWHGEERTVLTRGNDGDAAEVLLALGSSSPGQPTVTTVAATPDSVTIAWDAGPGSGHRVAWGGVGDVVATYAPGTTQHTFSGLCENTDLTVRVIRDANPWHIGSADTGVRSANAAPAPPRILSADANGSAVDVRFELPSKGDLTRVEYHWSANEAFEASPATLVRQNTTGLWSYEMRERLEPPGAGGFLRIRSVDSGGLSSLSTTFQVGGTPQASQSPGPCDGAAWTPAMPTPQPLPARPSPASDGQATHVVIDPTLPWPEHASPAGGSIQPGWWVPWVLLAIVSAVLIGVLIGLALRRR